MKTFLNTQSEVKPILMRVLCTAIILLSLPQLKAQDLPGPAANLRTLPTGSYIIPMDNTFQFNGSALFNIKAYGLIVHLLNNGIRVQWAIKAGKAKDGIDFSATTQLLSPTLNTTATLRDFRGGPFVIFQPDTLGVMTLLNAFNAANGLIGNSRPKIQRTTAPVVIDIRYDLNGFRPKAAILNDGGNEAIHQAFMVAASIPSINYAVSAGRDLISGCYSFASEPHNDRVGPVVDTAIMSIRDFVLAGGNFLAECEAVENYENSVYGRFQTSTGLTVVNTNIGTNVSFPNADLSYSQIHGAYNGNPSGSLRNWRVNASGINNYHNHINGTLLNSGLVTASASKLKTGAGGLVFYLGGHSFSTADAQNLNGLRMFFNAFLTPSISPCTLITLKSDITSFAAETKDNAASFNWAVSANQEADYFELQESYDSKSFSTVARIRASIKAGLEAYNYVRSATASAKSYYRVVLHTNQDGKRISRVISLDEAKAGRAALSILENPVANVLNFQYGSTTSAVSTLNIYNSTGVKLHSATVNATIGINNYSLSIDKLAAGGLYYLEITNKNDKKIARFNKR
jgi:hypothetical protein